MHNFNGTEKPMLNTKITASIILNTAYDLQKLKFKIEINQFLIQVKTGKLLQYITLQK